MRELGDVVAIVASHPHMFGVQVEWSRALGGVPVLVSEPDARLGCAAGPVDPAVVRQRWRSCRASRWSSRAGIFLVARWCTGRMGPSGHGVLLGSDTIQANPDRASMTFMRSYPTGSRCRRVWLSGSPQAVSGFAFDRLYDNFGHTHRH